MLYVTRVIDVIKNVKSGFVIYNSVFIAISLCLMVLCCTNCKKKEIDKQNKPKSEYSTPPITVPVITNATQLYDQLSHVALNLASIVENTNVNNIGSTVLTGIITSSIPSGLEESSMLTIDDAISTSPLVGPKFTIGSATTSDLFQTMLYCSNIYTITPPIVTTRQTDFYSTFTINGKAFFTLLRIPEFAIQGVYSPTLHGSLIFVPKDILGQNSYSGFVWNSTTNSVDRVSLDDDIVEDHIVNSTAYIVVVDFDEVSSTGGGRNASNCEGGWDCTDGYCDSACGEYIGCQDCGNQFNKRLFLSKIRIDDDERITKGGTPFVLDKHYVSALGSKYRLALNSVVLHSNGKFEAINNEPIEQKWKKNEVKRVIHKKSGPQSRGTATWKEVNLKNESMDGILLSNHFNMTEAKVYINLYELDFVFGGKFDFFAPLFNGFGIQNAQHWRSSGMPSLTGPSKGFFFHDLSLNPVIFDLSNVTEEVLPVAWSNVVPVNGVRELEIKGTNVTFTLKLIDK